MSIVSSETIADAHTQIDGRRYITHYFTNHLGGVSKRGPKKIAGTDTETEYAAERTALEPQILEQLANKEIQQALSNIEFDQNYDNTNPQHQTQAEFDRRVLAQLMTIIDVHHFRNGLNFFQQIESRGGANANQRATYLGVSTVNYNLIADRYGDIQGAMFFIDNEKGQVWQEVPEEFN